MTSVVECDRCGFRQGRGNDLYATRFDVDQTPQYIASQISIEARRNLKEYADKAKGRK